MGADVRLIKGNVEKAFRDLLGFSGPVYENQNTATADAGRRFETSPTKLRDVVIKVSTYPQLFGNAINQRFRIEVGGNWSISRIDISTLYFKNVTAGQNGVVNIIGVRE